MAPDRDPVSPLAAAMFTLARGLDIQRHMDSADFARPSEFIAKAG